MDHHAPVFFGAVSLCATALGSCETIGLGSSSRTSSPKWSVTVADRGFDRLTGEQQTARGDGQAKVALNDWVGDGSGNSRSEVLE